MERPPADPSGHAVMTLGDHLDELRRRVILALVVPVPIAIAAFAWAAPIRDLLCEPAMRALRAHDLPAQLQVLNPVETLGSELKLSLVAALVLAAPWIALQVWKFVEPGLYAHERRFVRLLVPMSAALTLTGLALLYFVLLPLMLEVLVSMGGEPPQLLTSGTSGTAASSPVVPTLADPPAQPMPGQIWLTPDHRLAVAVPMDAGHVEVRTVALAHGSRLMQQFRLSEYLDFTLDFALGITVAFQTPLVVLLLGWLGLLTPSSLARQRRYAIFAAAVIGAVVTPSGDPFSMALLAVPIYLLYELGILMLRVAPPSAVARGEVLGRLLRVVRGGEA